jgi:S-adenosylmethionine:tRNA ribosyltransferase-isomerase
MDLEKLLKLYHYKLPAGLIAQEPAKPRDKARILIYNRQYKQITFDTFSNIGKYLPRNSVLVFNKTKVVPARLALKKPTGGKVEVLYISHNKNCIKALANKKLAVSSTLTLPRGRAGVLVFKIAKKDNQFYYLKPNFPTAQIKSVLQKYGQTPLPPYIKHSKLNEAQKRKEYQSVFAKSGLSVAAPTASLHFTSKLMRNLKKQGIEVKFVTLNVNLGTFAPLKEENLTTGRLHSESYEIDKKTLAGLNLAKARGKKIIAVGTTVIRTLESASQKNQLRKLSGQTQLFIQPGYSFKFVNGAITNFHVPKSSLMMLIAALIGRKKLLALYKKAIKNKFRFFSFGDAMLILP